MVFTLEELIKLKTKLALKGAGAKGELADKLKCKKSQVSRILDKSKCPKKYDSKLKKYIGI